MVISVFSADSDSLYNFKPVISETIFSNLNRYHSYTLLITGKKLGIGQISLLLRLTKVISKIVKILDKVFKLFAILNLSINDCNHELRELNWSGLDSAVISRRNSKSSLRVTSTTMEF